MSTPNLTPRTIILAFTAAGLLISACAGNGNEARASKSNDRALEKKPATSSEEASAAKETPKPEAPAEVKALPQKLLVGQEDEIIPVVGMPTANIAEGDDIPDDPKALKEKARKELAAGNTDDALSMIDVLLVLNPEDAELIEVRSDILMKKGLKEDAAVDRARCCKLGRATCCP